MEDKTLVYAGFWIRLAASIIDTVLMLLVALPFADSAYSYFNWENGMQMQASSSIGISWIFPFIATMIFWVYRSATPGKMILKLKIVNAMTGEPIGIGRSVIRYIGYYISAFPLCLGFLWIAFSSRKQGWHDLIAGTVVVKAVKPFYKDRHF